MIIDDSSKYGTVVTEDTSVMDRKPMTGFTGKAFDRWLVRFGNYSVFRLCNHHVGLEYHPLVSESLRLAASQLGLLGFDSQNLSEKYDNNNDNNDKARRLLLTPGPIIQADGTVVQALIRGTTLVAPSWIEAWLSRKVWKNNRPGEEDHPVRIKYMSSDGNEVDLKSSKPLLSLYTTASLKGIAFLWVEPAVEEKLMACADLLGAQNEIISMSPSLMQNIQNVLLADNVPKKPKLNVVVVYNACTEEALRAVGDARGQLQSITAITSAELLTTLLEGKTSLWKHTLHSSLQHTCVDGTNALKEAINFKAFKRKENFNHNHQVEIIESYVYHPC